MFENYTKEVLLQNLLDNISNEYDKRDGSFIKTALASCAVQFESFYSALDAAINETNVDTASLPYMKLKAKERNVEYTENSKATVEARIIITSGELTADERFFIGNVFYAYKGEQNTEDATLYMLECEEAGALGNISEGTLIYDGTSAIISSASIVRIIEYGNDADTADELRDKYYDSLDNAYFGGNKADYKDKAMSVSGVKGVQVRRAWKGAGTVKLVINGTDEVTEAVQALFDPIVDGIRQGTGIAPIDHEVTAVKVGYTDIDIQTEIEFEDGYTPGDIRKEAEALISTYIDSVADDWAKSGGVVRIGRIESLLMSITGVIEATDTLLNNGSGNLIYNGDFIPLLREVTINVKAAD